MTSCETHSRSLHAASIVELLVNRRQSVGGVMKSLFVRFVREDQGQDLIEYALLAGFISLASVAAITIVGTQLNALYTTVAGQVTKAAAS
jgi:pilus assembly protein Flp/PilA